MWGYRFRTSVHSVFVRRNSWGIIFISINTSVVLWRCDSTVAQKNTKCKDNQNLCFDVRMCTFSNCKENSLGVISIITCSVLKRCHWTVAQKNMKCEENQNRCFNDRQCFESQIASKLNNHKELLMDWPLKKKMSKSNGILRHLLLQSSGLGFIKS